MPDNFTPRLKDLLRSNGCRFVRQGKGDHEIWYSPISNKRFMVDNHIKSRHWANHALRQAGLPKAF
jgi:ribosomal protein L16/L10AE